MTLPPFDTPDPDPLPYPYDDDDGGDVFVVTCNACGSDDCGYIGEAWDEDDHIGGHYECFECGHEFNSYG